MHFLVFFFFKAKKTINRGKNREEENRGRLESAPGTVSFNGTVFWFYLEEMKISVLLM